MALLQHDFLHNLALRFFKLIVGVLIAVFLVSSIIEVSAAFHNRLSFEKQAKAEMQHFGQAICLGMAEQQKQQWQKFCKENPQLLIRMSTTKAPQITQQITQQLIIYIN